MQDSWRWTQFTKRDGLPSLDVSQIVETDDGILWANTAAGIAWYDNYSWKTVPCPALLPQVIRQIQPLKGSTVLATGKSQPLLVTKDSCRTVSFQFQGKPVLIIASSRLRDNRVVLQDNKLNYYSWDGVGNQLLAELFSNAENVSNQLGVALGPSLFLSNRRGLFRLDASGPKLVLESSLLPETPQVRGPSVRAAAEDSSGNGLISVSSPRQWVGIWQWTHGHQFEPVPESQGQIARQVALSDNGDALAVFNSDMILVRESGKWTHLQSIPAPLRFISAVYFDRTGRLWVGSAQGIHLLQAGRALWSRLRYPFPSLRNHVTALLAARDGSLWAGTADGLVQVQPDGSLRHEPSIGPVRLGLVTGLAQDAEGGIWCTSGSSFTGAYRFFAGAWRKYGPPDGLPDTHYHRAQFDPSGRLWVLGTGVGGQATASGAFLFERGRFTLWDRSLGLKDSRVYSVTATPDGTTWFATATGISAQSKAGWRHWPTETLLKNTATFYLIPRPAGGVFFLDRHHGLGQIDAQGVPSYTSLGGSSAADSAWEIAPDPGGNLWLSTRSGLYLSRSGVWTNAGATAGLENAELWPIAFWRNHVCTGGDGSGLHCLNLDILKRPPPLFSLDPPIVDKTSVQLSWRLSTFGESITNTSNLVRYRLDSQPWSAWSSSGSASLSSLPHGKHQLQFQAVDRFGAVAAPAAPFPLHIPPPFYLQPIFWIPVAISLIAAIAAIYAFVSRTYHHNRQLADKEESFRALIEYSSVGITLWDRNRRIFYVSPAVSIILGYDPDELLGDFRGDLIHPDDLPTTQKRLSGLLDNPGQTQRSRVRMKHKNGQYRWIETISRNLFDNPSVGAIVTNLRDITDSTNAEMAAAEARQRAENANQAKSDFLAMISHEIRTPMNGITGMCQLLLESNLNREQQDYAETIAQSAQSLLALINDVLDFSRIEAGKLTIERAPIDLGSLLQEVAQLMRVRANEKQLTLSVTYPPDAPRAFYGDALRIRQILFNLTGNAVKFTQAGSVCLDAHIAYDAGSRYSVSITVKDTGIGIAEDKLQSVFQKFTQADVSTTRRYGGSGLGLSISSSLAELMGGRITASSVLNQGSEFTLELQLDAAPENALQRRDSSTEALQPLPEPLDILLVEDNKVNQKLALRLLEKLGCHAMVASSGVEALELLDKHDYDLILMDCQMPEMDGYEATRRIREREHSRRHIPIVAITANAMEADLERCLTSGMDSYLTKPIDFLKLRHALETWGIDYRAPRATSDPSASSPPSSPQSRPR